MNQSVLNQAEPKPCISAASVQATGQVSALVQSRLLSRVSARHVHVLWLAVTSIYLFLCFIKLPVTLRRESPEQSWEAVLSFAAAHHLQWGADVVFTFGPLGFLTSDHYWGNF